MKLAQLLIAVFVIAAVVVGAKMAFDRFATDDPGVNETTDEEKGFLMTRRELNDKLEDIRQRREEIARQIDRLDERKQQAAEKLRGLGIETADDLESSDEAKLVYSGIKRTLNDIEQFRKDLDKYDAAIIRIEAGLADLDRQQLKDNAGINEEQAVVLDTIIKDLDDRLIDEPDPVDELNTQEILDDLLDKDE